MAVRLLWWAALLVVLAPGHLAAAAEDSCPRILSVEAVLGELSGFCSAMDLQIGAGNRVGVIEGDEATLVRAINLPHMNREDYVAVLFYASWCSFSKICKPNFQKLATMFPAIRHFAFEEAAVRPSILSRYGVHGFPTLFLLNSTMRVRYHGPRTVDSLAAFYSDVSGVDPKLHAKGGEAIADSSDLSKLEEDSEQENCPFGWARSPENLLQQDTYLALAIAFVVLRLTYLLLPKINSFIKRAWRRHTRFAILMNLHEYFLAYVEQAKQRLNMLNPSKQRNLHEGAMNARAWASKSLASVSIGETSTGRAS